MTRQDAAKIDRLTQEASRLLDQSVGEVAQRASARATSVYRSSVGRAMGNMAAGLLFPIWRDHADLEPDSMKEPGDYNPREFEVSEETAAAALGAIAQAVGQVVHAELQRMAENGARPEGGEPGEARWARQLRIQRRWGSSVPISRTIQPSILPWMQCGVSNQSGRSVTRPSSMTKFGRRLKRGEAASCRVPSPNDPIGVERLDQVAERKCSF